MRNRIEDGYKIPHVFQGKNRIEHLSLLPMVFTYDKEIMSVSDNAR